MERMTYELIKGSSSDFSQRVFIKFDRYACCISWNLVQQELVYYNTPHCVYKIVTPEFNPCDITLRIFFDLCGLNTQRIKKLKSTFSLEDLTLNPCWDNYIDTPIKDIPVGRLGYS